MEFFVDSSDVLMLDRVGVLESELEFWHAFWTAYTICFVVDFGALSDQCG